MIYEKVREAIVKYIFIGKQKIVLGPKLKKNQRKTAASVLKGGLKNKIKIYYNFFFFHFTTTFFSLEFGWGVICNLG
jgi:hypothetical protein